VGTLSGERWSPWHLSPPLEKNVNLLTKFYFAKNSLGAGERKGSPLRERGFTRYPFHCPLV